MLKISNLSCSLQGKQILYDVNLEIKRGDFLAVVGPNGAGKSTLLRTLLGLVKKSSGQVELENQPLSKQLFRIAYVAQSNTFDWQFPLSVRQLVELSLLTKQNFWRSKFAAETAVVDETLAQLEIKDLASRHIAELSGGQKQRVLLARVLCQPFDILILDEPFTGIDHQSEKIIMSLLRKLQADGKTIVMVHHNLNTVKDYFDQIVFLNKTVVAYGIVEDVFTKENLRQTYQGEIYL